MFDENARDALISHLGYDVKQTELPTVSETPKEVVEEPVAAPAPASVPIITAEDLFASAPMEKAPEPEPEPELQPEPEPEPEPAMPVPQENAQWREELKQSIIVGDFVGAVNTCFQYHQFADAFVIASWGGPELVDQTTVHVVS